jgi:lipopolysaccharide transport system ATP-binding protein
VTSSSIPVIVLDRLGKQYRIASGERAVTAAEHLLDLVLRRRAQRTTTVYEALRDVSATIAAGDIVGLIGRNGAGKSTLLKVLSRITPPSSGSAVINGRVGSLLEVGTGFHPELTGRENIYLNGTILGMRRREIDTQFDDIVEFAGVGAFLDTPVKRYSSGMYVRLAFSVAAHLRTEVLLVDEVLAVGDQEFQERSLGKMHEVSTSGRTVILVSHGLDAIARLCNRAILLDKGAVLCDGTPTEAIERYRALREALPAATLDTDRPGTGEFRITEAAAVQEPFTVSGPKRIRFTARKMHGDMDRFFVAAWVIDARQRVVAQIDTRFVQGWVTTHDTVTMELVLHTPWLKPGHYDVDLILCNAGYLDRCERACSFEVLPFLPYPADAGEEGTHLSTILSDFEFRVE